MRWITSHWRLKVLAVALTIGLLSAVAFSENPPEVKPVQVGVGIVNLPENLVIMNPPVRVQVTVVGLKSDVDRVQATNVGITFDMQGAHAGPNQTFAARVRVASPGVTVREDTVQQVLTLEQRQRALLDVDVRTPKLSPGLRVTTAQTLCSGSREPCKVAVTAPLSVLAGLKPYINYDLPINNSDARLDAPSLTVAFEQKGKPIDLANIHTFPSTLWEPPAMNVHIETAGGTLTRTVGLTVTATGTPACGYKITSVDVQPNPFVTITGPTDAVAKLTAITLGDVAIGGATGTLSVTRPVTPSADGVRVDPSSVRVVVGISPAFSCQAAPPPPAQPTPTISPTGARPPGP